MPRGRTKGGASAGKKSAGGRTPNSHSKAKRVLDFENQDQKQMMII